MEIDEKAFIEAYSGSDGNDREWQCREFLAKYLDIISNKHPLPIVGQLRDYDKGSEVWTGDKWVHYSDKSWKEANYDITNLLSVTSHEPV